MGALWIVLAFQVLLTGALAWMLRRARATLNFVEDLEDLDYRVGRLEHRAKMIQGRLNAVAPPREGTGAGNGQDTPIVGPAQRPMTRSELARMIRARR